ncbi:GDP-mannose 4,6-dehydratase [Rahnella aceris]
MSKVALITCVSGQDGYYLAELLLKKGYKIHSISQHVLSPQVEYLEPVYDALQSDRSQVQIHYGHWSDASDINSLLAKILPDEIYNLGTMNLPIEGSVSPEISYEPISALKILEAIRYLGLELTTRYYHASPPELCGLASGRVINEMVSSTPCSSQLVANICDFWTVVSYRKTFGMYACNGILFNHESPLRNESFVTRKITRGLANITQGLEKCLYLGNLNALRDWGHARDYVKMQWLMLQQDKPEDFVIATGVQFTVRQFVTFAALELGIKLRFVGKGIEERGIIASIISPIAAALKVGDVIVAVDSRYIRSAEKCEVLVKPTKARRQLGWGPETSLQDLIIEMVQADLVFAKEIAELKSFG